MERDYDTPEGKEGANDEAYMMPMEKRDPMMWDANVQEMPRTILTEDKRNQQIWNSVLKVGGCPLKSQT